MKWWVYREDRISEKAYPKDELKDLSSLSEDTLVCSVKEKDWRTVSDVSELRDLVTTNGNGNGNGSYHTEETPADTRRYPHFSGSENVSSNGSQLPSTEQIEIRDGFLEWEGTASTLQRLHLKNLFLSLVTLGIYSFWGKSETTNYTLENLSVSGETLDFNSNPLRRCWGTLSTVLLALTAVAGVYWLPVYTPLESSYSSYSLPGLALFLLGLYELAWYRTRGYVLGNLSLGSFRFRQTGSAIRYSISTVGQYCLIVGSLGLYYPVYRHWRLRTLSDNTVFNGESFEYTGEPHQLVQAFLGKFVRCTVLPLVGLLTVAGLYHTLFVADSDLLMTLNQTTLYWSVFLPLFGIAGIGSLITTYAFYHEEEFSYVLRNISWKQARFDFDGDPRNFSRFLVISDGLFWLTASCSDAYFTGSKLTYFQDNIRVESPFFIESSDAGEHPDTESSGTGILIPGIQLLGLFRL